MTLADRLSENHRRSLSITLQLLDETLCGWDDCVRGHFRSGVIYFERDSFSNKQKRELSARIVRTREIITRLRDELLLQPKVVEMSRPVMTQASSMWETLLDVTSRGLTAYGHVPPEISNYIDRLVLGLADEMLQVAKLISEEA